MVSAKLLVKPLLRRYISFGPSYCSNYYRYEKLESEHEQGSNESIISSINSFDSFHDTRDCDGGEKIWISNGAQMERDAPPADDTPTIRNSISSVLFSVGESTWSDECSYSYSLCSDSSPIKRSSHSVKWEDDVGTFDTSAYSNSTFELNFISRHAGLDYGGRTPPKAPGSAVISPIKAIASPRELRQKSPRHDDEDVIEGARIVKKQLSMSIITPDCPQLEKTFDSSFEDEDLLPTPSKLFPRSAMDVDKGHRVRKWLRKSKPASSRIRSMNSPAA